MIFLVFALCPLVWAFAELLEPEPDPKFMAYMLTVFLAYIGLCWYFI